MLLSINPQPRGEAEPVFFINDVPYKPVRRHRPWLAA
jgi:hypothetical protein